MRTRCVDVDVSMITSGSFACLIFNISGFGLIRTVETLTWTMALLSIPTIIVYGLTLCPTSLFVCILLGLVLTSSTIASGLELWSLTLSFASGTIRLALTMFVLIASTETALLGSVWIVTASKTLLGLIWTDLGSIMVTTTHRVATDLFIVDSIVTSSNTLELVASGFVLTLTSSYLQWSSRLCFCLIEATLLWTSMFVSMQVCEFALSLYETTSFAPSSF